MELTVLLDSVLDGHRVTEEEAYALADTEPLEPLLEAARTLTDRYFGDVVSLCGIYAARVGRCSGDCAFCAQSAHHNTGVEEKRVEDIDPLALTDYAGELREHGVSRFSLVTSGESLSDREFDRVLELYGAVAEELDISLCASLGGLTPERAKRLYAAGIRRYHHNVETAPSYFPGICSTHTMADKLETIAVARAAGMEICCGGIIGMGESRAQRVEMALYIRELGADCVPINILNPIPGTRLEGQPTLPVEEILRTIAVFRLIMPETSLRFAGGRERAMGDQEYLGFLAGIDAGLFGNYLTTPGKGPEAELETLRRAGRQIR